MSKMKFESALRYKEEAFIKFKKDFGHAYGSQTYHLHITCWSLTVFASQSIHIKIR